MQSFVLIAISFAFLIYSTMQNIRILPGNNANNKRLKIDNLATNILNYENVVAGYLIRNQESLHLYSTINYSKVEKVTLLNNSDMAQRYRSSSLMFNYKSASFNYASQIPGAEDYYPNFYLITSFNQLNSNIKGFKNITIDDVLGSVSNKLGNKAMQGDSTYWNIPWIFEQENCKIKRFYSSISESETSKINFVFGTFCSQLRSYSYQVEKYVYLQLINTSSKY